jgi:glutamate-1-semialdehyde 2,1-aminomutase
MGHQQRAAVAHAQRLPPGGVNSPVRAFGRVMAERPFGPRDGARLYDVDGHEYIDYVMSWGAILLATRTRASLGHWRRPRAAPVTAPGRCRVELAQHVVAAVIAGDGALVNSGTEATMSALRWPAASAATGRDLGVNRWLRITATPTLPAGRKRRRPWDCPTRQACRRRRPG